MSINLKLDYENADDLFLQMLFEGYENNYSCYKDDFHKYVSNPTKYNFLLDDITDYYPEISQAYERLAEHYSSAKEVTAKRMQAIRDRIDTKYRIAAGMSMVGGRPSL